MREIRTTSSTGGQKGVKLERHDLIPAGPLKLLAEHFGKGAMKYSGHQWRQGYEWSKSYAAKQRHDTEWLAGRDYDTCENEPDNCAVQTSDGDVVPFDYREVRLLTHPAHGGRVGIHIRDRVYELAHDIELGVTCYNHTGSHHLVASAWHAFVLLEFAVTHPEHDDRYKPELPEAPEEDPDQPPLWEHDHKQPLTSVARLMAGLDAI